MPANPSPSLVNINGHNVSSGLIGAPSSDPVHPFYLDLVHGSTTSTVPTNHSHLYLARVDCNHVQGGDVSQSRDTDIESLMPDIFNHSL